MSKILNRMNQLKIIGRDLWINSFGGSYWVPKFLRKKIYQIAGIITYSGNINPKCYFSSNKVKIGKGVWIGANVTILPGVTIGDGCIIAAGAVVNKNCEANSLYAGVPAVKVKTLAS